MAPSGHDQAREPAAFPEFLKTLPPRISPLAQAERCWTIARSTQRAVSLGVALATGTSSR